VDSFFPLVEEIEEHVMAIESVVHNEDNPASNDSPVLLADTQASRILAAGEKVMAAPSFADEKHTISRDVASVKTTVTRFSLPRLTCGLMLRRWRRAISRFVSYCTRNKSRKVTPSFTRASFDLYRMARTRQLATSVARVLATKPEVVAGIRKRLLASVGPDASDEIEIAIYFGDVQGEAREESECITCSAECGSVDHILTLQQSLAHYERMLSESHPMYIQNLHFDLLRARAKGDYAMFVLAMVTVMVVPPSVVTGMCTPYNRSFTSQVIE
jgi:magnesium transporter